MTSPFDRHVKAIKRLELKAVNAMLTHFGSKAEMATALEVTIPAINLMQMRGKIGRYAAMTADANPKIPFRLEDLRADHEDLRRLTIQTKPKTRGGRK